MKNANRAIHANTDKADRHGNAKPLKTQRSGEGKKRRTHRKHIKTILAATKPAEK